MDARRSQRVAEALREEVAEIIEYELSDPRIGVVAVTDVQVTPDLRHAEVRVQCDPAEQAAALEALENARSYVRRALAGRLRLFRIPEIHFAAASGPAAADRIEQLLQRVKKNREKAGGPPDDKP